MASCLLWCCALLALPVNAERLLVSARLSATPGCPAAAERCYDSADIGAAAGILAAPSTGRYATTDPGYPGVTVDTGGAALLELQPAGHERGGRLGAGVLVQRAGVLVPLTDLSLERPPTRPLRIGVSIGSAADASGRFPVDADVTLDDASVSSSLHMLPGRWYTLAQLPGSAVIQLRVDPARQ